MPGRYFRRKKIDQVLTQLKFARASNPNAKISILAHSFGTYIVAEIITSQPDIIVHRLVFCGSIVPFDHPFLHQIGHRITDCIVNDVGTRDVWPALANSVTTGYGDTGTYGFRSHPKVRDRWFKGFKHSDFFLETDFCKENWIPFFKQGENGLVSIDAKKSPPLLKKEEEGKKGEEELVKKRVKESLPFWLYWLSVIKIKVVVPLLVLVTLIWWQWNYLTQLCKLT
jgi:pimeloyl-ACP methyl ester carboxylesterase